MSDQSHDLSAMTPAVESALFDCLIALGDDALILGHRLSEWAGHAPMLEEDLSLANMGLDLLGHARGLLSFAGQLEGADRSEDDLAYLRAAREYRHCLLVERPNGDFAHTMVRQMLFSAFMAPYWHAATSSCDPTVAGIAGKAAKELDYHLRHAGEWVIRLGDGTDESAERTRNAFDALYPDLAELMQPPDCFSIAAAAGLLPETAAVTTIVRGTLETVCTAALLPLPDALPASVDAPRRPAGREGRHTETFGHLLAELQVLPRSFPDAHW